MNKITNLLENKIGIITGVANKMSIAYYVAKLLQSHGAKIIFTYPSDKLKKRVYDLAGDEIEVLYMNVLEQESIDNLFEIVKKKYGKLDILLHSIAFSDKEELRGRYLDTSLENFLNTMHISCYSLTSIVKSAETLMQRPSNEDSTSILTLSYYGSNKVIPGYNVMGVAKAALESSVRYLAHDIGSSNVRVNAISAGPIRTLASSGIGNFMHMLDLHGKNSPLKRNTTQEDVAKSALYFLSNLSNSVTGEIHYVDSGYNTIGIFTN